jgi:quercetin dioxygenase-like cupin family protein
MIGMKRSGALGSIHHTGRSAWCQFGPVPGASDDLNWRTEPVNGRNETGGHAMKLAAYAAALAIVGPGFASPLFAADDHKLLTPQEVKWGPSPPSMPKGGAEIAVLYGDPTKDGLFAMRIKMPKGYHIPPHNHPKPEVVTVISGTFGLGTGDKADQSKAKALPAGSFFAMSPGMNHFGYAIDEAIVQVNSTGPWGLTYVNEKDDPRKTQ